MSQVGGHNSVLGSESRLLGSVLDEFGMHAQATGSIGELLLLEGSGCFTRVGRISPLPVPSRDRVTHEPWRMAVAALFMLGERAVPMRLRSSPAAALLTALQCGLDCSFMCSVSCVVDAAAGLLGVDPAAALEALAEHHGPERPLSWGYCVSPDGELDFLPLLEDLVAVEDAALGAALCMTTLAEGLAEWILRASAVYAARRVALWGDCLTYRMLAHRLKARLGESGVEICQPTEHRNVAFARLYTADRTMVGASAEELAGLG